MKIKIMLVVLFFLFNSIIFANGEDLRFSERISIMPSPPVQNKLITFSTTLRISDKEFSNLIIRGGIDGKQIMEKSFRVVQPGQEIKLKFSCRAFPGNHSVFFHADIQTENREIGRINRLIEQPFFVEELDEDTHEKDNDKPVSFEQRSNQKQNNQGIEPKTLTKQIHPEVTYIYPDVSLTVVDAPKSSVLQGGKKYKFHFFMANKYRNPITFPGFAVRINGIEVWRKVKASKSKLKNDELVEDFFLWNVNKCSGTYTVAIVVDPDNKIKEKNKDNNIWRKKYQVKCPNLNIISLSSWYTMTKTTPMFFNAQKKTNRTYNIFCTNTIIVCTVINNGQMDSGDFLIGVWSDGQRASLDNPYPDRLKAGEQKTFYMYGTAFKYQKLTVKLDYTNLVNETNESDNSVTITNLCLHNSGF